MNIQVTPEFRPHVAIIDGQIKTTSLKIAEHFGKRHTNVLRAIKNISCSPEFHQLNFALMEIDVEIGMGKTRKDPVYEMTRDGFTFLAMGFTGKQAAQWKEAYINAFNAMERELIENIKPLPNQAPVIRTKILFTIEGHKMTQQEFPFGCCIIDPNNAVSLQTVINEYVPVGLMLDVINAASRKLAINIGRKN